MRISSSVFGFAVGCSAALGYLSACIGEQPFTEGRVESNAGIGGGVPEGDSPEGGGSTGGWMGGDVPKGDSTEGGDSTGGWMGGQSGSSGDGHAEGGQASESPNDLGAKCEGMAGCASGHCVNGVCCDAACDGVCEACTLEGHCAAAESDVACPTVSCTPRDNQCLTYGAKLSGGTCKDKGVCKTTDDCPRTPKAANEQCDIPGSSLGYCDGAGACVLPTVDCGGECTVGANQCCYYKSGATLNAECLSSCPSTYLAANPARTPVDCDSHSDCRTGYLCSLRHTDGESNVRCRSSSLKDMNGANYTGQYQENREVCASPVMIQRTCSSGTLCERTFANFPGWKFCNL